MTSDIEDLELHLSYSWFLWPWIPHRARFAVRTVCRLPLERLLIMQVSHAWRPRTT